MLVIPDGKPDRETHPPDTATGGADAAEAAREHQYHAAVHAPGRPRTRGRTGFGRLRGEEVLLKRTDRPLPILLLKLFHLPPLETGKIQLKLLFVGNRFTIVAG